MIISSDQKYPSPFYEPQTFSSELFCSSVLIDMTVKNGLKKAFYMRITLDEPKTKMDVNSANASEGISCSKLCHA